MEEYSFEDATEITASPVAAESILREIEDGYSELSPYHVINIIAEEGAENGEGEEVGGGANDAIPHLISIGPNHYGNPKLSAMETQKTKLLDLESRKWNSHMKSSLTNSLLELEERARKCNSHNFNSIDRDAFVKMMLTDAFFLINLFTDYNKFCKGEGELSNNFVFTTRWGLPNICQDLLMLDNQLPFFILAQVYVILTNNKTADSLKKLALQFFKQVHFGKVAVMENNSRFQPQEEPKHLLDLFHSSFIQMDRGEHKSSSSSLSSLQTGTKYWVNNASTLSSNGVTFIARDAGKPLDIEFNWLGLLRIPTFCIDDRNINVLKNLLAYEQASRQVQPYFTCLVVFFSNILATPGDVKCLREAGIIQHQPGNDQMVVLLLQQLCKEVEYSFEDCLIKYQVECINKYVTSARGMLISYMKRIFLANFVGIVLFIVVGLFLSLSFDSFNFFRFRL